MENNDDLTPKAAVPDHGQDPAQFPGTPQAAEAEALQTPTSIRETVVDIAMRQRVSKRKAQGIWHQMLPQSDFPGVEVRMRTWNTRAMQVARAAYETKLKARNPKTRNEDLPPEEEIELNRFTAVMSLTGLRGTFKIDTGMSGRTVTFDGSDDEHSVAQIRRFISEYFLVPYDPKRPESADEVDMDFLQSCLTVNSAINKLTVQEIDYVGEDYVFGASESIEYRD